MKILDRSIAMQFFTNALVLMLILGGVVTAVDYAFNFDEYFRIADRTYENASWAVRAGGSILVLLDLWWPRLFLLYDVLLGFVLVGAMGFTLSQMVRHRELVAILASGLSLRRVARPIMLVGLTLVVLQGVNREFMLPRLAPLLAREKGAAGSRSMGALSRVLHVDGQGRVFYARSFDMDRQIIYGLWVWERDVNGLLTRRITASEASWDGSSWILANGQIEDRRQGVGNPRPDPLARLQSDLDPTIMRMRRFEGYASNLSFRQLTELIDRSRASPLARPERLDELTRYQLGRFGIMACNLLTLLACLPFFLKREPTNMLAQSLRCAPAAIGSLMGAFFGTAAALPGLPPEVSVFVPVMILIPLAIAAMSAIKT
jgi:lipopolysaccharide export system permease protein